MDTATLTGGLHRGASGVNVFGHATRKPGDLRTLYLLGDRSYGREITFANNGKPGLNDIHLQAAELPGHREFFPQVHRRAGTLLAVTQGGIENQDSILTHFISFAAGSLSKKEPHRQLGDEALKVVYQLKTQPPNCRKA